LDAGFADDVRHAIQAAGADTSWLTLELTETSVMADPDRSLIVLDRLAAMGIALAIDDFGTGYSSLTYLKRLPVSQVKIDKSFVLNMSTNESDATIVQSIVDLGRNLKLVVVAEGIEDAASWDILRELGCDQAQGYYLARPMPAAAFGEWIKSRPAPRVRVEQGARA
jgi:EAL domain-containing protein (putative c-di-GMP-specific phosphodiesterase class I)